MRGGFGRCSGRKRRKIARWSRRQESNLYLPLRRRPFYPLNYGEAASRAGVGEGWQFKTWVTARAAYSAALPGATDADRRRNPLAGARRPAVRYRVDYEVVGNAVNYKRHVRRAGGPSTHEGAVRFRSRAASTPRRRSTPSCRTTSPSPTATSRPDAALAASVTSSASVQITSTELSPPAWARTVKRCATR